MGFENFIALQVLFVLFFLVRLITFIYLHCSSFKILDDVHQAEGSL
jgi:hypothetical protein